METALLAPDLLALVEADARSQASLQCSCSHMLDPTHSLRLLLWRLCSHLSDGEMHSQVLRKFYQSSGPLPAVAAVMKTLFTAAEFSIKYLCLQQPLGNSESSTNNFFFFAKAFKRFIRLDRSVFPNLKFPGHVIEMI
jgi:hypothetical protein